MDTCIKIVFKDKTYEIKSVLDFNAEHSKTKYNYVIETDAIPIGLLNEVRNKIPIKVEILDEIIWRPEISIKTKLNKGTKQLQYTITVSEKGEE